MPALALTGRQKRHLRSLGHHLDPVAQVGREGVSDAVVRKVDVELENHELIKVKVGENCLEDVDEVAAALSERCNAAVAQTIGRVAILYRRRRKEPTIELPKTPKAPKAKVE